MNDDKRTNEYVSVWVCVYVSQASYFSQIFWVSLAVCALEMKKKNHNRQDVCINKSIWNQQEHMKNYAIYFKSKTCEITQICWSFYQMPYIFEMIVVVVFFAFVIWLSVDCNWIVIRVIPICSVDLFSIMDLSRWAENIHTHRGGEAHTHMCHMRIFIWWFLCWLLI